jgi:[acyl-carrier-protein] S-malonyltransferase
MAFPIFPIGLVFPGQGSQSVGMLTDIAAEYGEIREVFTYAKEILHQDLWHLATVGPKEELDKTIYTQPVLLTAAYALWQILQSKGLPKPALLAGHSLGEYTALVCADALSFSDALMLVSARARYMQEAVPEGTGAMAAIIGLENEAVQAICQNESNESNEVVEIANYNSIGQVVIAGHTAAVERVITLAKEQKAKMAVRIPVSVPSHCLLMKSAADKLFLLLEQTDFQIPAIPVINNVNVQIYQHPDEIRVRLKEQLYCPVRWVETIQYFAASGIKQIIECGPGKVLTGLNKRIDKNIESLSINDLTQLNQILSAKEGA